MNIILQTLQNDTHCRDNKQSILQIPNSVFFPPHAFNSLLIFIQVIAVNDGAYIVTYVFVGK